MGVEKNNNNVRLRVRRAKSVAQAEEFWVKENKAREAQPDSPCHKPRDSLLSSSSGYTNYRGVLNLCIVLLVLSNARVALENIIKYGILIDPVQWLKVFVGQPMYSPSVLIMVGLNFAIVFSLIIEKLLSKGMMNERLGKFLIIIHLAAVVLVPPVCVYTMDCNAVVASFVLGFVSIAFLKLVSYHMVNSWCRESIRPPRSRRSASAERRGPVLKKENATESIVTYPNNLNLKDIYYFTFAPTLCYELNFPRSARIRKRFLIKRAIEMLFLIQLILCLVQQWIVPTINNSLKPLQDMDFSRMLERLLKLAVPNHFIWLIFFYWYFHSVMNTVAELLRFADREFYSDWWLVSCYYLPILSHLM